MSTQHFVSASLAGLQLLLCHLLPESKHKQMQLPGDAHMQADSFLITHIHLRQAGADRWKAAWRCTAGPSRRSSS